LNAFRYISILLICLIFQSIAQEGAPPSSSEKDYYEKLGLSLTEWQKIKENKIPMEKVYKLMEAGISMTEYFTKPWINLSVSEQEWINKRRAGQTNDQISRKDLNKAKSEQYAVVTNLFLPGFHEWKRRQFVRSSLMTGGSIASLALSGVAIYRGVRKENSFSDPTPCIVVLPVCMIWSAIDIHFQIQKEINPAAQRFNLYQKPDAASTVALSLSFPIPEKTR